METTPAPAGIRPFQALLVTLASQRELLGAAGWSLLAAIVARGASLFALVICARLLEQAEFGQVAIIQSTVGMFAPLASLGLAMTSTKFVAEYRDADPARAGRILGLSLSTAVIAGLLMTGLLVLLAPWIATSGFAAPDMEKRLVAASGLLVLGVIESAQTGALAGLAAFSGIARAGAWSGIASIPVIALLTRWNGAAGAIAGLTISLAISCVMNGFVLRQECRRFGIRASLSGLASERGVLLHFSLPSYVSGLLVAPVAWLAGVLLIKGPDGFSQMAIFSAADRFRYLLIFVPLAISRIAVPALSRLHALGDAGAYRRALKWNLSMAALATAVPACLCILGAAPLMSLFGEDFRPGWLVLAVLAYSAIPTVLNTQLGAALLSEGRAWERSAADVALAAFFLSLAWLAVPRWGALGLAASFSFAYSAASILLAVLLWRSKSAGR
jgi:O-antigen/teichoic acid export membrane protein